LSRICVLHFMLSFESRCTSCTTNEHMRAYVEICTRGYAESVQVNFLGLRVAVDSTRKKI
jgi:hypothetical protein